MIAWLPLFLQAQKSNLFIQGTSPSFYLNHTVGAKENYYSIGRLYNTSPSQQIAPFNDLKMEDGLKLGQSIRIPLNEVNFTQDAVAAADEVLVPVLHVAGDKESLWSISTRYNKVPVASIRKWNKLEKDQVSPGARLTVGFLKVKKDQSALASGAVSVPPADAGASKRNEPVKVQEPAKKETAVPDKKTEPVIVKESTVKENRKQEPEVTDDSKGKATGSGYFKSAFEKQENSKENRSGSAGVFKSTSGWDDGKYYCLYNDATPGTIVKVTNPSNKKFIYAKVLDAIPDMKQNDGLIIRVSNAAAGELGITGSSFECSVSY